MKDSIDTFLRTGGLQRFSFGSEYREIVLVYGKPEWTHKIDEFDEFPCLIKYDVVELHFNSGRLTGISIRPDLPKAERMTFDFDTQWLKRQLPIDKFEAALYRSGIKFTKRMIQDSSSDSIETAGARIGIMSHEAFLVLETEGKVSVFFEPKRGKQDLYVQQICRYE
jgi:hypothetical protein